MHEAKIEAYIPICNDDAVEINADKTGCQINVMINGSCAYRLNLNDDMVLKMVDHSNEKEIFSHDLISMYYDESDECPPTV